MLYMMIGNNKKSIDYRFFPKSSLGAHNNYDLSFHLGTPRNSGNSLQKFGTLTFWKFENH